MTFVCIQCGKMWDVGQPTTNSSGTICESCFVKVVRKLQRRKGRVDCFMRATEICANIKCRWWKRCCKKFLTEPGKEE